MIFLNKFLMIENNDFKLYQSIHFFYYYYYYLVHFSDSLKKKKIVSFPISFLIS